MNTEWLSEIIDPNETRAICQQRYRLHVDGIPWVFVTNGNVFYAIENALGDFPHAPSQHSKMICERFVKKEPDGQVTTVASLRDWAGQDTFQYCTDCCEDGLDTHGKECKHCDGSGYINFEYRHGRINDVLINRYLIAKAFHHLPDGPVHVVTDGPEDAVFFIAQCWRVVVMPLRYTSGPIESLQFTAWNNVT